MGKQPPFRFNPRGQQPSAPPYIALDRFGKMLEPGHLVMFHSTEDLIFEVIAVEPVLSANLPQGQQGIRVTLSSKFPVEFFAAMPNRSMVLIGETQERIALRAQQNGNAAAVPEPHAPSGIVLTDPPAATEDAAMSAETAHESGRPCGCDPGAGWVCERHRAEAEPDGKTEPAKDID